MQLMASGNYIELNDRNPIIVFENNNQTTKHSRSLICIWVLLIHCGYFGMFAYDNLPMLMAFLERIEVQPFFAIIFYVDVFFVLR